MAFRQDSGLSKWKSNFRIKSNQGYMSSIERIENPRSTIQGEKKYSASLEAKVELTDRRRTSLRVKPKRASKISPFTINDDIDAQQVRADGYLGGDGGKNQDPNKLVKDKMVKAVAKEPKPTITTEVNVSENSAGRYQGGEERADAMKSVFKADKSKDKETSLDKKANMVNKSVQICCQWE